MSALSKFGDNEHAPGWGAQERPHEGVVILTEPEAGFSGGGDRAHFRLWRNLELSCSVTTLLPMKSPKDGRMAESRGQERIPFLSPVPGSIMWLQIPRIQVSRC